MKYLLVALMASLALSAPAQVAPQNGRVKKSSQRIDAARIQYVTGVDLLKKGMFAKAEPYLSSLNRAYPGDIQYTRTLGECLVLQGKFDQAILELAEFSKARGMDDPRAMALLALSYSMTNQAAKSREMMSEPVFRYWFGSDRTHLAGLPNRQTQAGIRSAWIAALVRDADVLYKDGVAIKYCEMGLQQTPTNPWLNTELGRIHLRNRRFTDARLCFEKALCSAQGDYIKIAKTNLSEAKRWEAAAQRKSTVASAIGN